MKLKKMYPNADEDNRYYLVLNPLESTNALIICGEENININNINLCYYLESEGKKLLSDEHSRLMILDITLSPFGLSYQLCATVLLQDIDTPFNPPKEFFDRIRIITIEFRDEDGLKAWLEDEKIENYVVIEKAEKYIVVEVVNLTVEQEFRIANYAGLITSHNGRKPKLDIYSPH